MNSLLKQMDDQDFVIETSEKLPTNFSLKNFKTKVIDENKFSLTLSKDSYMNDLFNDREISHLKTKNIRNQTNRLEELFIKLTTKDE